MKSNKKIWASGIFIIMLVTGIFWFKPDRPVGRGMVVTTLVPSEIDLMNDELGMDKKYIPGSKIVAINIDNKDSVPVLLTEEFHAARSPEVSYDGKDIVFSGKKNEEDNWQIYIKDLQTLQVRQVTSCPVNCTDPAWLPDGRIVFSRLNHEEKTGELHVIYSINPDGSGKKRLTFHPNSAISSTITDDGRIVMVSSQVYPEQKKAQLLTMRRDGTKGELFYGNKDMIPVSRSWENNDGQVYFIEDEISTGQRKLVSVAQGHPLSSWTDLSGGDMGNYNSVYPTSADRLLVSYRPEGSPNYGLYAFSTGDRKITDELYINDEYHVIEPVLVEERELPMRLPSRVVETMEKGTFLCHNTEKSSLPVNDNINGDQKTHAVQILGLEGLLGEAVVEEDGSFYIELDADMPVRFQSVNASGEVLRGPSSWIWVRPNERRSCMGCHEDHELAPENRVPQALYGGMVKIPEGKKVDSINYKEL